MKNLGKIVLLIVLSVSVAQAKVRATLDSTSVEVGEMVTYSLHISGKDIVRPTIGVLCGVDVISTASQTSIEMINGNISRSNVFSYKFMPMKSCSIEPMEVKVDSQIQKSNEVSLKVQKAVANKDADFVLTLQSTVKEVYVGEPFEVILNFKQKKDAEAVDSEFSAPKLKGFWVKSESKPIRSSDGEYNYVKIKYMIAAQRVGELKITKAKMRIASRSNTRDSWGSWIPNLKWRTYFSNELDVSVKALPAGVSLVGDFIIMATADKQKVDPNEAVNVSVEVLGDGNLEDIKSFKPYVDGVNIFDEKIAIRGNKLTQKIVFVGDSNYTIPSFSIKYFDPLTKEIKETSTNEIVVKVNNAKPKVKLEIKRDEKQRAKQEIATTQDSTISTLWAALIYVLGLASGIALMFLKSWKFTPKKRSVSIKNPKELLVKLMPYREDKEVQIIIDALEKSVYEGAKLDIDKKQLKEILKKIDA